MASLLYQFPSTTPTYNTMNKTKSPMLNEQLLDVDDDDVDGEASIEPNTYELVEESINKLGIEYTEESSGERSRRRYVHERIDRVVMVLHGIIVVISGIYVVLMMTLFYCLKRHLHQMLISNVFFFPLSPQRSSSNVGVLLRDYGIIIYNLISAGTVCFISM